MKISNDTTTYRVESPDWAYFCTLENAIWEDKESAAIEAATRAFEDLYNKDMKYFVSNNSKLINFTVTLSNYFLFKKPNKISVYCENPKNPLDETLFEVKPSKALVNASLQFKPESQNIKRTILNMAKKNIRKKRDND